jgi:threonine/homoserine/homoserine lactone efflux protein
MLPFWQGLLLGFSIAAPVGPIGVLCIRRSISDGRWIGLATGLGAATADAAFGCVAAFGLTAVSGFLVGQRFWLGLVGGLFLCWLGVRTWLSKPAERAAAARGAGALAAYGTTFVLTLTNPMTILSFAAVFAGLGLGANASSGAGAATALVGGVFLGSALWWLLLSTGAALLRERVTPVAMHWINRSSGAIITAFGVYALVTLRVAP